MAFSNQPSTNCTLKSCSFPKTSVLLLHAFILQFILHWLFRWFVSCLCTPPVQTLRAWLIGSNSWVSFRTENLISGSFITHIINASTHRSSSTCDLRPKIKCSYSLPNLSLQFFTFRFFLHCHLTILLNLGNPYITLEETISQKKMSKYNWKAQN